MSLSHNPSTITNGLVYYHDMNNTQKSWKGAPTTNLVSSPNDISATTQTTLTKTINVLDLPTGVALISPASDMADLATGNGWIAWTINPGTAGIQYMCSWYVKAYRTESVITWSWGGVHSGNRSSYNVNLLSGEVTSLSIVAGEAYSVVDAGNGWWRIGCSTTLSGTGSVNLYPQLNCSVGIYLCGMQIETGSVMKSFVIGTRSNTQALLDLTGSNTITTNSLTYASDGTFSFNGSSDYVSIPFNSSLFTFNNQQTICIWLKPLENDATRRNPYNQAYGGGGTITHEPSGSFNYYYGTAGSDTTPYTGFTSSFTVVQNETAYIVIRRTTDVVEWYKNGVFSNSQVNPYGASVVTGTSNILIGSGYAGSYQGYIYNVQVFNRALSATEISQNFNALRGRYGL